MYAGFIGDNGEYVAGDYTLSTTLSYRQLLTSFKPSKAAEIISITIPEGYTTDEIIGICLLKTVLEQRKALSM